MKSIIYDLQTDQFPRFRIGIGGERKGELADYVLGGFKKEDREKIKSAVENSAKAIELMLVKGIDIAMGEYNKKVKSNE